MLNVTISLGNELCLTFCLLSQESILLKDMQNWKQ